MNRRAHRAAILLLYAFILAAPSAVADGTDTAFSWSTGFEYSSGTYGGNDDIEDLYVPIIARVDSARWSFELVVPYLSIRALRNSTISAQ